ncbi:aminoglycoside phosphotransferase [Beutenbergia cavernae DSM 12333]|uniref:Aminoglycoside phosphotransferase n=1 Tax=Beutenbergia cavernae (strain ATCC BAA-8 / DSM 12333 / CCUG 43141 / JCM 11478 / NBRC 16432 / NCIMB 13614 / HKI 0122) TaxID=471853 RepID=C5C0L7_BEUC1|nr:aminoglycoside phosphotransferase family protein [Beutenbergia cavernae]ACQ81413.1 aminoglycoside phosphotransferase [Beutenbergia cavernae DSM 12333]
MITTDASGSRPGAVVATEARVRGLLTGAGRDDVVRAALGARPDQPVAVRVDRVQHRVGLGVSVGYDVRYGAAQDYLVVSSAPLDGAGLARLERDGLVLHAWRHPHDPALPGLAAACDVATVARWLPGTATLEFCSYRPLRRAVVRAVGADGAAVGYLKVVRPGAATDLVRRHDLLADAGVPAPLVLTAPTPGVVLLTPAPGTPLLDAPVRPRMADVLDVLEELGTEPLALPARPSWADRVEVHADGAVAALGTPSSRPLELAARLRRVMDAHDAGPLVATHGDLHPGNLFVADGEVSALIDVDSLGPGHRVDDVACLLAHLSQAAVTTDVGALRTLTAWLPDAVAHLPRGVGYPALAARAGAVVLSLVGVAASAAHRWRLLALARAWCVSAETARLDPLMHHLTRRSSS